MPASAEFTAAIDQATELRDSTKLYHEALRGLSRQWKIVRRNMNLFELHAVIDTTDMCLSVKYTLWKHMPQVAINVYFQPQAGNIMASEQIVIGSTFSHGGASHIAQVKTGFSNPHGKIYSTTYKQKPGSPEIGVWDGNFSPQPTQHFARVDAQNMPMEIDFLGTFARVLEHSAKPNRITYDNAIKLRPLLVPAA